MVCESHGGILAIGYNYIIRLTTGCHNGVIIVSGSNFKDKSALLEISSAIG